jgi:hypothetical protein
MSKLDIDKFRKMLACALWGQAWNYMHNGPVLSGAEYDQLVQEFDAAQEAVIASGKGLMDACAAGIAGDDEEPPGISDKDYWAAVKRSIARLDDEGDHPRHQRIKPAPRKPAPVKPNRKRRHLRIVGDY